MAGDTQDTPTRIGYELRPYWAHRGARLGSPPPGRSRHDDLHPLPRDELHGHEQGPGAQRVIEVGMLAGSMRRS